MYTPVSRLCREQVYGAWSKVPTASLVSHHKSLSSFLYVAGYSGEGIARYGDWNTVTVDETKQAWGFVEYVSGAHQNFPGGPTWSNWAVRIFKLAL